MTQISKNAEIDETPSFVLSFVVYLVFPRKIFFSKFRMADTIQFLQKLRESSVIKEKSSTLPRIIMSMRTHLATGVKTTYEKPSPTFPMPVPTLLNEAIEALMAVLKSAPEKSRMTLPATNTRK